MTQPIIGEISHRKEDTKIIGTLSYQTNRPTMLSCMLLDEKGRVRWSGNLDLQEGGNALEFHLPSLPGGHYNMWIEVEGKTVIRPLSVEMKGEANWMKRVKQWVF